MEYCEKGFWGYSSVQFYDLLTVITILVLVIREVTQKSKRKRGGKADNTLFKVYPIKQLLFILLLANGKNFRSSVTANKCIQEHTGNQLPKSGMEGGKCQRALSFLSIYSGPCILYIISFNPHNNSVKYCDSWFIGKRNWISEGLCGLFKPQAKGAELGCESKHV